jgi:acetyl-CoA synthetase
MVIHDFTYPLGHIITASYWHNLHEDSLHLTVADTGWGKAVWGKLYGQWIAGACVFVYDHEKFSPADMLHMIEKYKITSFCAPPTIFRFLIREDLTRYDLSSLKYGTIAGEALNPSVYKQFFELTGIKLREGFGQTETTLTILTTPWIEPKPGSMGIPSPQYDVDLITPDGRSAEDGEQGEIIVRTSNGKPLGLFMGYYRDVELTLRAYNNNIYYTGDVAWRDEDGYYWFVGRNDDVIKSSGYRIGPFEVESALMTHPAVVECAITGVPDEVRGQIVKATIVLAKEYKLKEAESLKKEIQDHVKKVTAPYKYPRIIDFVDELPKTISGKIRRVEIREKDHE